MAAEKRGYTLTDRGTWIKYQSQHKKDNPLIVISEDDKRLFNQYSVIIVNPEKCPQTKAKLANSFATWITSNKTQKLIADFRLLGQPLFVPNSK